MSEETNLIELIFCKKEYKEREEKLNGTGLSEEEILPEMWEHDDEL